MYWYFSSSELLTFWIFSLPLVSVFLYAYSCNTVSRFPIEEWPNGIYRKCRGELIVVILLPIRVSRRTATALLDSTNFPWGTYRMPKDRCLRRARMWPPKIYDLMKFLLPGNILDGFQNRVRIGIWNWCFFINRCAEVESNVCFIFSTFSFLRND